MEEKKPMWLHKCEQCYACLQWCPQESIQIGKKTSNRARYHHLEVSLKDMISKKDLNVNATNKLGNTPLHHAAVNGWTELARLLIDNGADLNIKNVKGETPLQIAVREIYSAKRIGRKTRLQFLLYFSSYFRFFPYFWRNFYKND